MNNYVVGGILVFLIIIMCCIVRDIEDSSMKGFWKADAEFCQNAELELFMMYLGDNTSYISNNRFGYILVANDQGFILNNAVKIHFSNSMKFLPIMSNSKEYNVQIDWLDYPPEDDVFPSALNAVFYPKNSKIVLYKDGEVLAVLWKDVQMSALAVSNVLCPDSVKKQDIDDSDMSDL